MLDCIAFKRGSQGLSNTMKRIPPWRNQVTDSMYEAILYVKCIIWINTEERIKGIKTKYWPLDDRWYLFFASLAILCIMHKHYNCIKKIMYVFW